MVVVVVEEVEEEENEEENEEEKEIEEECLGKNKYSSLFLPTTHATAVFC